MNLIEMLDFYKKTSENIAIAGVKAIKSNVYTVVLKTNKVFVENFPKLQKISGSVSVNNLNQSKLEKNTDKNTIKLLRAVEKFEKTVKKINIPEQIAVNNLKDIIFPKKIEISNPQKTVSINNFYELKVLLGKILKEMQGVPKELPKYECPKFPEINFPQIPAYPKDIKVNNLLDITSSLLSSKPNKYIPVRLTDGKEFYKALEEVVEVFNNSKQYSSTTGLRTEALIDSSRKQVVATVDKWVVNDRFKESDLVQYIAHEDIEGNWMILKVTKVTSGQELRYATKENNNDFETYAEAFENLTSLEYGTAFVAKAF